MDEKTIKVLFALLHSAIRGERLTQEQRNIYSSKLLDDLLKLSAKHDVIHLLALGIKLNELTPKDNNIEKYIFKAALRYERLQSEYKYLCDVLEKSQIPFLPLKGSVIRKYYPEAWMRTSCDIDILVHEGDVEKAKIILVSGHGYTYKGKGSHDISLFTPRGIHIELHYDLIEDSKANGASTVLKNVWDAAKAQEGFSFWYEMPDELYYFYHIAHMAKHFENGGCGIRPFIDLFILDTMPEYDTAKRNLLLDKGDLLKFANVARKLSRIWLGNEKHDSLSQQMEDYILRGGVYGNSENRIMVQQQKKGGRIKYALSKIFIPYDEIKFHYPVLEKHRWLTPIMEIRRWFKLIFCGHLKRTTKELKFNSNVSDVNAANTRKFLSDIGL